VHVTPDTVKYPS